MSHTQPWVVRDTWCQTEGDGYAIEGERDSEREANRRLIETAPALLAQLIEADRLITQLATVIVNTKIGEHIPFGLKERTSAWLRDGATTVLHKAGAHA